MTPPRLGLSEHVSSWHVFHRWTAWSAPKVVAYTQHSPFGAASVEMTQREQARRCSVCGLEQVNVVQELRP